MNAAILLILAVTGVTAHNDGDVSTGTIVALSNYANPDFGGVDRRFPTLSLSSQKAYASANRDREF